MLRCAHLSAPPVTTPPFCNQLCFFKHHTHGWARPVTLWRGGGEDELWLLAEKRPRDLEEKGNEQPMNISNTAASQTLSQVLRKSHINTGMGNEMPNIGWVTEFNIANAFHHFISAWAHDYEKGRSFFGSVIKVVVELENTIPGSKESLKGPITLT